MTRAQFNSIVWDPLCSSPCPPERGEDQDCASCDRAKALWQAINEQNSVTREALEAAKESIQKAACAEEPLVMNLNDGSRHDMKEAVWRGATAAYNASVAHIKAQLAKLADKPSEEGR